MMLASEGEQYKYVILNIFSLKSDMYKSSKHDQLMITTLCWDDINSRNLCIDSLSQ